MKKILVVGSINMDMITTLERFPELGETVAGNGFKTSPGGKGANQAAQIAKLATMVTMVGKLGQDAFGAALVNALQKSGVDSTHLLYTAEHTTGIANIILEKQNNNTIQNRIIVVAGANGAITLEDVAFLEKSIKSYQAVILQFEIPMAINIQVAQYAKKAGIPVILNPAPAREIPSELYTLTDYLCPNETEAALLTGLGIKKNSDGTLDADDLHKIVTTLLERGAKNIVITLGANGVAFANASEFFIMPCLPARAVLDPTAAGDSFIGAFATALIRGLTPRAALEFASLCASITVARLGAQESLPTISEVKNRAKELGIKFEF